MTVKGENDVDFYHYYLRRIESRPDQKEAIQSCRDMAIKLFDTGPLAWSIESGAALLGALCEAKIKPGIDIMPIFSEIEESLLSEIQGIRLDIEADRQAAIQNTGCGRPQHHSCRRCD